MKWIKIAEADPPEDKWCVVYYENGEIDRGYILAVRNSGIGWLLPSEKMYMMVRWALIEELPEINEVD